MSMCLGEFNGNVANFSFLWIGYICDFLWGARVITLDRRTNEGGANYAPIVAEEYASNLEWLASNFWYTNANSSKVNREGLYHIIIIIILYGFLAIYNLYNWSIFNILYPDLDFLHSIGKLVQVIAA